MPESFLFAGEIIGGCRLAAPLRLHSESETWFAVRDTVPRLAAVKVLRPDSPGTHRFLAAAGILHEIECPSLVRVLESGVSGGGFPFAVTEYAEGGSLAGMLSWCGMLTLPETVSVMRQVLNALAALHGRGIVHRDVKPGNIWFDSFGNALLGDLGIARIPGVPEPGPGVFGTASYMSPEQAVNSSKVDSRSDFFSLASVVFECLTGKRRFPAENFTDVLKSIISCKRHPEPELAGYATLKFASLLGKMMERSASLRPRSAELILKEMDVMSLPEKAPVPQHLQLNGKVPGEGLRHDRS